MNIAEKRRAEAYCREWAAREIEALPPLTLPNSEDAKPSTEAKALVANITRAIEGLRREGWEIGDNYRTYNDDLGKLRLRPSAAAQRAVNEAQHQARIDYAKQHAVATDAINDHMRAVIIRIWNNELSFGELDNALAASK